MEFGGVVKKLIHSVRIKVSLQDGPNKDGGGGFIGKHFRALTHWDLLKQQSKRLSVLLKTFGLLTGLFAVALTVVFILSIDDGHATIWIAQGHINQTANAQVEKQAARIESLISGLTETTSEPVDLSEEEIQDMQASVHTGWYVEDGVRYYLLPNGECATGTIVVEGVYFSFDEEGRWQSSSLDVPYICQLPDMPFGCEVVSVTMMLNYAGVDVTKEDVAYDLPYDAWDPNVGFTGSLYYYWDDFGGIIWPPALLDLVFAYLGSAVDLTGYSWSVICEYIDSGRPVCIWIIDDEWFDHTILLTGYSDTEVWINDPLSEWNTTMSLYEFMFRWEGNGYRALSY